MNPTSPEPEQPAAPAEIPSVPGYDILGFLDAGGAGAVWRARQHSSGQIVALKVLDRAALGSARARLRFDREVRLAGRLRHPHIARVHDVGSRQGVCFYAMELIDGLPLDKYVRSRGLGPRGIASLMRRVCRAADHAHAHGVIHRDLKPSNILVDAAGDPHLLDFGLARNCDVGEGEPTLSLEDELAGTPAYMSPEQAACRGEPVGTRSDVYTLGVILYRLLTGASPHDLSGSTLDVLRRVAAEEVVPPRRVAPDLDRELETVLLKALAHRADERYSSAAAMADDLGNFLSDEPLAARPPGTLYFLRKRLRRHRAPLAGAAVLILLLLGFWAYASVRIARERDAALKAADAERRAREEADGLRLTEARARHSADESWVAEMKARQATQGKALDLAWALLPWGDAQGLSGDWGRAGDTFRQVGDVLRQMEVDPFAARLCLADADRSCPPALATLTSRPGASRAGAGAVRALASAADGRTARAVGAGGGLEAWSLDGAATDAGPVFPGGAGERASAAAFTADGRFAVVALTGPGDGFVAVWASAAGKEVARRPMPGGLSSGLALSADGLRVAFAAVGPGTGEAVWLWDVGGGAGPRPSGWAAGGVRHLAFSPDGGTVFTADHAGAVRAWDLTTGEGKSFGRLPGNVIALAAGDGGHSLVAADHLGNLGTWDVASPAGPVLARPVGGARLVAASPAGSLTASSDEAGRIEVREIRRAPRCGPGGGPTSRCVAAFEHGAAVTSLAFSADGGLLFSGDAAGRVRVWDLLVAGGPRTAPSVPAAAGGSPGDFTCLALSPDGRMLLTGDSVGNVRVCDRATGRELASFVRPDPVARVAFAPDGATARAADLGGGVADFDLRGGRVTTLPGAGDHVWDVDLSPDGRLALFGGVHLLRLVDLPTGRVLHDWPLGRETARVVRLSPGGRAALFADLNGHTTCLDVGEGLELWTAPTDRPVRSIAVTAEDGRVLLGLDDGTMEVRDAATGRFRRMISAHVGAVAALAACPDGRSALSAGGDGVRLWDLSTGRALHTLFRAPAAPGCLLADGDTVACGGDASDGVWLWDLSRPRVVRDAAPRAEAARVELSGPRASPASGNSLRDLSEWYALRGRWDWSASLLRRARAAGESVSPVDLADALWGAGDGAGAAAGFRAARLATRDPAEERHLLLCEVASRRRAVSVAGVIGLGSP